MSEILRIDTAKSAAREVDGELVIFDLASQQYLAGNSATAILWPMLVDGTTRDALADRVRESFDIGPEVAAQDVEQLLVALARMARDRGSLSGGGSAAVERVCEGLEALAGAAEAPARLHGDLWGGNVLADSGGRAWLVDPAAYGGHREIDLAMLRLFGSPPDRAFAAYHEVHPLGDGHEVRVALWQLLPLLVHTALVGGSYGAAAGRAARRYL